MTAASVALAFVLAGVGYAAGWLTLDGSIAAGIVGGTVFAGGGVPGGLLLAFFFVSGSVLTQLNRRSGLASGDEPATGRTARQVTANGLFAAAGAALVPWRPETGWAVMAGAIAAAQSDTWATELGARGGQTPRLITTWQPVPRGTSGAVSGWGTFGGILGALAIAWPGSLLGLPARASIAGFAGGVLGMLADSLLGATVQGRFHCDACNEDTERRRHRCGRRSCPVSGWRWLDNDGVNLLATATGALGAALVSSWP